MRTATYPKTIRDGNVTLKLYRVKHGSTSSGFAFTLAWVDLEGKAKRKQFSDEAKATAHGKVIADQLATGQVEAAHFTADDREELLACRKVVDGLGLPVLSALKEWAAASLLAPGQVVAACEAWAARQGKQGVTAINVEVAVAEFVAAKNAAGKQGTHTYTAKLKSAAERFRGRALHSVTGVEWTAYLATFSNGVTRNDRRKRVTTLCRWAQRNGYLPRHALLEVLDTERARENVTKIGIIDADTFQRLLVWFKANHPNLLGAVALACYCGIRSDEIHGKRGRRSVRQLWADIHLDRKFVQVTVAKTNTPAWRLVPLCDAAVEWLKIARTLNPKDVEVCEAAGIKRARKVAIEAKFTLPENCFRHSFISHRVAQLQDKPRVALEAGNSVKEIDRRYRVPLTREDGDAWFALHAAVIGASPQADPPRSG